MKVIQFSKADHTHAFFLKCEQSICQIKSIIVKKNAKLAVSQEIEKGESREFYIFRCLKNDELKSDLTVLKYIFFICHLSVQLKFWIFPVVMMLL